MGIPIGAVRQALQKEGKDPNIIDMDPSKTYASQAHGSGGDDKVASPALKDDPEFSKFFKVPIDLFLLDSFHHHYHHASQLTHTLRFVVDDDRCSNWVFHWVECDKHCKKKERILILLIWIQKSRISARSRERNP